MEKVRRKRTVSRKPSHIHCRTCRARKVRCGGQRPDCHQCVQSSRQCGGYDSWEVVFDQSIPPHSSASSRRATFSPSLSQAKSAAITPIYTTPRQNLHNVHVNDEMRHAFDYFRYRCYMNYAQRGYPTLWASYAVKLSISEPAVFLAAAALGTLEISVLDMVHTSPTRTFEASRIKIALELYSAAISWARKSIADAGSNQGSLKPVILACLVFIVFEVTRGNTVNAMRHARIGNSILNERLGLIPPDASVETSKKTSSSPPTADLASMSLNNNDSSETPLSLNTGPDIHFTFSTLEEARFHLEALTDAAQEVQLALLSRAKDIIKTHMIENHASQYCLAHTLSKSMPLPPSSRLEEKVSNIQHCYLLWRYAFTQLLESGYPPSRNVLRLQVRFFCASLPVFGCRMMSESWTDTWQQEYRKTLEAAEQLLQQPTETVAGPVAYSLIQRLDMAEGNRGANRSFFDDGHPQQLPFGPFQSSQSSSSTSTTHAAGVFDHGILPALLMIACKCRDSALRHRAVDLLARANRMEALVASHRLARVAKAVVALEEQLLRQNVRGGIEFRATLVPEVARFSDVVASPIDDGQGMTLSCTQHNEEKSCIILLEYECLDSEDQAQGPTFKEVFKWQFSNLA